MDKSRQHVPFPVEEKDQKVDVMCENACSGGTSESSSTCVTECEAKVYECARKVLVQNATMRAKCQTDVLTSYKKAPAEKKASTRGIKNVTKDRIYDECSAVCGDNVNSTCITNCEMEMYQCRDHTLPSEVESGDRDACEKKVLEKYKGFKADWDEDHALLMSKSKPREQVMITNKNVNKTIENVESKRDATSSKNVVKKKGILTDKGRRLSHEA